MQKALVTAENNISKVKQTRTPKDYNAIENGALKLSLEDKINLRNSLSLSIDYNLKAMEGELKDMEEKYNAAKELIAGKN